MLIPRRMRWYGDVRRFFDLRIIQISTADATIDTIADTERKMAFVLVELNNPICSTIALIASMGRIAIIVVGGGVSAMPSISGVVSFIVLLILSLQQGMNWFFGCKAGFDA